MADFLPSWWKGPEYINIEDLFEEYFSAAMPDVKVVHWINPEKYNYVPFESNGTEPTLRLWRQPGQRDFETNTDVPLLQVAAITRDPRESWELLEFVSTLMKALNNGHKITRADGSKVQVKDVAFWRGPTLVPEGPVDEFFIPVTYEFTLNGLALQPNYREILDNLS